MIQASIDTLHHVRNALEGFARAVRARAQTDARFALPERIERLDREVVEARQDVEQACRPTECFVPLAGEPSFVLLGRDPQAPSLIEAWAAALELIEPGSPKPAVARLIAERMRQFKQANPRLGMPAHSFEGGK